MISTIREHNCSTTVKLSSTILYPGLLVLCVLLWMIFKSWDGSSTGRNAGVGLGDSTVQGAADADMNQKAEPGNIRKSAARTADPSEPGLEKIYKLPLDQQALISIVAFNGDLSLSWQIIKALDIVPSEQKALKDTISAMSAELTKWEMAQASVIEGTNILKIPPSRDIARSVADKFRSDVKQILGEERGDFFVRKANTGMNIMTGNEGRSTKLVKVSLNMDESGQPNANSPYLVQVKVLNDEAKIDVLDWTAPDTFASDSISNLTRSQTFKEIPAQYAHLIDSPSAQP